MGTPLAISRSWFISHGLATEDERERIIPIACKGTCAWRFDALGVVTPHTPQDSHLHLGSTCTGTTRCLECGHEWHTNTRSKGEAGSWSDFADPTIRKVTP